MNGKKTRWSLVTSASGKIDDVGISAIQNQAMPKAVGRSNGCSEARQSAASETPSRASPARIRTSFQVEKSARSVSAVRPVGMKNRRT